MRLRLAAGFATGLLVVLILAGGFVYVEVADDLSRALDASLATRADDVGTLIEDSASEGAIDLGGVRAGEEETTFTQVVATDGRVVESTLPGSRSVLDPGQLDQAGSSTILLDGVTVRGLEGMLRVQASPVQGPAGTLIAVVGATTSDRQETLSGIRRAFAIGSPIALLLASVIGYALGARALAPVEAMRSRAREITLARAGERLPVPAADDELRSLADTLNEMLERVETALQRERVFVADASHELRTPLAVLKSEIELVRRTGGSKADLERTLDSAAEEVDHLVLLAEDLLVIARAEQGRLPLRREPVDVGELLERVGARFSASAERSGRELEIDGAAIGSHEIDRLRVEQALGNVLDNAFRYGSGTVRLRAAESDGALIFSVIDEGPGFPGEFRSEAFERFTQAEAGHGGIGAGLGLAIVRAIAQAHGGDATIADGPGGADVRIRLPAPRSGIAHAPL